MLDGASRRLARRAGDPVYAGSFCVSGRAAYQAQKVGAERRIASLATSTERAQESQTPLERIVTRVLTTLLAIVGILALLLLSRYLRLGTEWIPTEQIVSAAGVIFALAPAGLYFMIFLSYAMGSVQLARHGALIHRARSIEALANATVLCLTMQATRRSNTAITLEPLPGSQDADIAESRLRQILGDFARSSSAANQALRAMVGAFPGERRAVLAEIPYLSAYGWSGVVLDDDDLRGVYVLGEPELLRPYLAQEGDEQAVEAEPGGGRLAAVRGRFASWGRRLRRRGKAPETLDGTPDPVEGTPAVPAAGQQDVAVAKAIEAPDPARSPEDEQGRRSAFRQWMGRARNTLRRRRGDQEAAVQAKEEDAEEPVQELVYLFAYAPEPAPLRDEDGRPQVPLSLIPLCRLHYTRQVRPETLDTLRAVAEMGIALKVFTPGPAEPEIALFRQAGLQWTEDASQQVVSGAELDGLEAELLAARVLESAIISHATPDLAGRVVQALRQQGESVVVVGDGPSDLPTMEQADLSIAWHNSSQAALGLADIVLLEDAPDVWLRALEKGQSIVNGLMDVLKLYLAVVACLTTLVIAIPMLGLGFPYHAKQGALINIATLVLPSLGLSLWAMPGVLPSKRLSLLLAWFAVPAAATMSLASLLLYYVFWVRTGELAYTQLALTHMLVFSGLALALLVRPTSRLRAPGSIRRGDRRLTIMVLVILGLFFGLASTPRLGEWLFHLSNLPQPADYGVIAVAALAWVLLALLIWWLAPERRFVAFLRRTLGVTHR
jgi:magnesium-transporting ATPase (P-type)